MYILNGIKIKEGQPFESNGTWYPSNWLQLTSAEEKAAIGITETDEYEPEYFDPEYYYSVGNPKELDTTSYTQEDGSVVVKSGLKEKHIPLIKNQANIYLSSTDWTILRKFERNIDIPDDIRTKRLGILAECDRLIAAISAATTVDELKAVIEGQNWPA